MPELEWSLKRCSGKSAGPDNIPYPFLQNLPYTCKKTLLHLYNRIWDEGKIPEDWKLSITIPILKPGKDPTDQNSYGPISLLNCISKVLERIINRRLMHELKSRKLLSIDQHAFRTGRDTETYFAALEGFLIATQEKKQVTSYWWCSYWSIQSVWSHLEMVYSSTAQKLGFWGAPHSIHPGLPQ